MIALRRWWFPVLVVAQLAQATTLLALDVPALSRESAVVARGTVGVSHSRWTGDHARIVTETTIEVREAWKGAPGKTITVVQPGGVVGEVGQQVHGTVRFKAGQEVVVFLEARGSSYVPTGMMQGVFTLATTADGTEVATQALEGDALLLDVATHAPVTPRAISMPVTTLNAAVAGAPTLDRQVPGPRQAPVAPVKPTP